MSENNMSLLSQQEVDTLINFIKEQNGSSVNGEVLSQNSVDKLISIIQSAADKKRGLTLNKSAVKNGTSSIFAAKGADPHEYELTFKCNDEGQVCLYACKVDTEELISIAPQAVTDHPNAKAPKTWGKCIVPAAFAEVASELGMNYSDETMDSLKTLFAKVMYGNPDTPIPSVYLP
ncbi:MAG: hypothetical protein SPL99_02345 [Catonella sp.]|nr:hypothetical protein [Catonella sp.]MDY6357681.1 hypothetical protein [Catonella sp.]